MIGLKVIKPTNPNYKEELIYKKYRLIELSNMYNQDISDRIHKWQTRLKVQMDKKTFEQKDPTAILAFLSNFKTD